MFAKDRNAGSPGLQDTHQAIQPVEPTVSTTTTAKSLLPPSIPSSQPEQETTIETERFFITFTNIGGSIKRIALKDYTHAKTGEPTTIIDTKKREHNLTAINDLYAIPGSDQLAFEMARNGREITYTYSAGNLSIEKIFNIHNLNNHIELWIKFRNLSPTEIPAEYGIIAASGIDNSEAFSSRYVETNAKVSGKVVRAKKDSIEQGEVSWVALKNKYFSVILKPYQFGTQSFTKRLEDKNLAAGLKTTKFIIPSQGTVTHQYLLYAGPNDIAKLKEYNMGLEEVVDYGVFGGISKIFIKILRFFHNIFRNWGLAIIAVTVLMNTFLYPLNRKSYRSMKQMQELQPHMEQLRASHKDNPQKLQKEMMELYRRYKVNPMGGCLPLFLQMPIIFAMYQTIMRSLELKGANFLWIKDLSAPDAVPLPFTLPLFGNSINILPIFMVVAMILQQKLSPLSKGREQTEQQKQQQSIMLMMPIMFGFIFYSLPSGLVLYWVVNTILMMINQHRVMKATPAISEA